MNTVEQPSAAFRPAAFLAGTPSPRAGHLPFIADLMASLKPSMIVELGVHFGDSYFGFCQIVEETGLDCSCYAVDCWQSSEGSEAFNTVFNTVSHYNNSKYQGFSHLLRKPFEEALEQFGDESIQILSIDGRHSYEELQRIAREWLPKVTPGGAILLSGISVRNSAAGARRLWDELQSKFPHFSFRHHDGLGVIGKGRHETERIPFLAALFQAGRDQQERIRRYYSLCAERQELASQLGAASAEDPGCSLLEVLYSKGGRYETNPELSHVLSPGGWVNLFLHLPHGVGDRALRIDVANRPAVVEIAGLCLRKADGQAAWTWSAKDPTSELRTEGTAARMPAADFFRVLSTGASPRVLLPEFRGAAFRQPLDLEMRVRVDLELRPVLEMNQRWLDLERNEAARLPDAAEWEAALAKEKAEAAKQLTQSRVEQEARIKQIAADAEEHLEAMQRDFEQQNMQLHQQLEEERRAHQAATRDRDAALAAQPRMLQEISIAQGNVEELKAELEKLTGDHATLQFESMEMRKINARLAAALEHERGMRASMQDSSSWQLTKPLRAVGDLFTPRKKY